MATLCNLPLPLILTIDVKSLPSETLAEATLLVVVTLVGP